MIRLGAQLVWREIDGEVVLLDTASNRYVTVNRTGSALWPLLAAGTTEAAMTQELVERFEVDPPRAAADVATFLRWLRDERLVTESADAQR